MLSGELLTDERNFSFNVIQGLIGSKKWLFPRSTSCWLASWIDCSFTGSYPKTSVDLTEQIDNSFGATHILQTLPVSVFVNKPCRIVMLCCPLFTAVKRNMGYRYRSHKHVYATVNKSSGATQQMHWLLPCT